MSITIKIKRPILNAYSPRQRNADVHCVCCGRGIPNRESCQVAIITAGSSSGANEITFAKIPWEQVKGTDSVEWGGFIGSHCAKSIPKEYKVSQRRVLTAWRKAGCP